MIEQVNLHSERLLMRPFRMKDAGEVQRLAGDRDVSKTTLSIPHPYEDGMAETWIASHPESLKAGTNIVYAMVEKLDDFLVGAINVDIEQKHRRGEFGYWVGKPFWGRGYCTEAAAVLLGFCFGPLGLHRVHARYLAGNPASGRVMEKIGMRYEGCLRQHVERNGERHDVMSYGILSSEHQERVQSAEFRVQSSEG